MYDQRGQVPELIVIDKWSVKKVVWTYEYDVKLFGQLLDLKGRVQEFKKLSPVMHEIAAIEASLAKVQ